MALFHTASDDDIQAGRTTDVYFQRTLEALEAEGALDTQVAMELTCGGLPEDDPWAVWTGVDEVVTLLEGLPVDVWAAPDGTIFRPLGVNGVPGPLLTISGPYGRFAAMETPLLGFLCFGSGVATKAARMRLAAGDVPVVSFGVRRTHPAVSVAVDRHAFIGGLDDVSAILSAERLGREPRGTMPHAVVLTLGDQRRAWRAFHEGVPKDVPRVALVDTLDDEVREALWAAEELGDDLAAVRLDTPGSRRGDFPRIVREVRWELDRHGHDHVAIFVSGGLTEHDLPGLREAGAAGFGVGTSIANARVVDFALDIIERDGVGVVKRGKFGGRKQRYRCAACGEDTVVLSDAPRPSCGACGGGAEPLLQPVLRGGERVAPPEPPEAVRARVLGQLESGRYGLAP